MKIPGLVGTYVNRKSHACREGDSMFKLQISITLNGKVASSLSLEFESEDDARDSIDYVTSLLSNDFQIDD